MRFRLTYDGELRPSQRDPEGMQRSPLAAHKHTLRKDFHRQLKELWATNKFLREHKVHPKDYALPRRPVADDAARFGYPPNEMICLVDAVAGQFNEFGYRFVPLVCDRMSLLCSLDILFLRRDPPGSAVSAGDIDNRLKTVIDALRRPQNALELVGNEVPGEGEDPFFCLLEDDSQVSQIAVETDTLLDPSTSSAGDLRRVRLVITVELRPYYVTSFNLSFA